MKYSIEVDIYSSQSMVNKVLSGVFYSTRAQQNVGQQYGFSDWQANQYGFRLDCSRDEFYLSLYENPGPQPVLFVSKAIISII